MSSTSTTTEPQENDYLLSKLNSKLKKGNVRNMRILKTSMESYPDVTGGGISLVPKYNRTSLDGKQRFTSLGSHQASLLTD